MKINNKSIINLNFLVILALLAVSFWSGCSGGGVQDISGTGPYTDPTATPYPTPTGVIDARINSFCQSTYNEGHSAYSVQSDESQNTSKVNYYTVSAEGLLYVQTVSIPNDWKFNKTLLIGGAVLLSSKDPDWPANLIVGGIETTTNATTYYNNYITELIANPDVSNYQLTEQIVDGNKTTWVYTITISGDNLVSTYIINQTLAPSGKFLLDTARFSCPPWLENYPNIFNEIYPILAACADTRKVTPKPGYEIITAANLALNFDLSFYTSPSYRFNVAVYDRVNQAWGDFINQ